MNRLKANYWFFFFCLLSGSRVFGQLNPPSLRCIETLANGDVKLTWVPVNDPGGIFHSYEIYTDTNLVAPWQPFAPVGTITAVGTGSFVHTGANDAGGKQYLVVTRSGTGGTTISQNSDTISTLWLGLVYPFNSPFLTINYFGPFNKPNPTTSSTYTLQSEYPQNNWFFLASTSQKSYNDTVTVCSGSVNYQVSIADISGCVSRSRVRGATVQNTHVPSQPVIDSISVLPDGRTILAWKIPPDKDIIKYQLQYLVSQDTRKKFDSVIGRGNTSYIYTVTSANNEALSLYVGAIDNCANPSPLNYTISTMYLKTRYNRCDYKTELNWNAYQFMPKGIGAYAVYCSVNGGDFKKVGETVTTSFTQENVQPSSNLCYFVRAFNTDRSVSASSNRSCFFSSQVKAPANIYLSCVSVRNATSVSISAFVDNSSSHAGIEIQRALGDQPFSAVGFMPDNKSAFYFFADSTVETGKRSYAYRLVLKDSCGNARLVSNVAKTIYLKANDDQTDIFKKNLQWSSYQGFAAGAGTYTVYRVIGDVLQVPGAGTTPSAVTSFYDTVEEESASGSSVEYIVGVTEAAGNPYNLQCTSLSNAAKVYVEDQLYVPNAFAPNGQNRAWRPVTHFVDKTDYRVTVFDRWGHSLFDTLSDTEAWDGGDAPAGVYVYFISYKNSRGEYKEKKGLLTLMR